MAVYRSGDQSATGGGIDVNAGVLIGGTVFRYGGCNQEKVVELNMKVIVLLAIMLSPAAFADECAIPGDPEHWATDYCLWINESDDFAQPGVQECYQAELKQVSGKDACKAKAYFKRKICEAHAYYEEGFDVDACLADPEFQGPTVINGGFKKPEVKSYFDNDSQ